MAMQPGQTISPGEQSPGPQQSQPIPPVEQSSVPPPLPNPAAPDTQQLPQAFEVSPDEQQADWQFTDNNALGDDPVSPQSRLSADPVSWTASEFVSHEKNSGWYVMVVAAAAALGAIIYLLTKDLVSPIVVLTVGIAFAAFGARKPRVLDYAIDDNGVHIGQKTYPYNMFRTFSVIEEGAIRSILLMPMQRFNLPISVYYDPADEERIVEALGVHLPHQDRQPAPVDNFMRKIRF